jgi:hypothetical protein
MKNRRMFMAGVAGTLTALLPFRASAASPTSDAVLEAAIASIPVGGGGAIYLPRGEYLITRTKTLQALRGVHIYGDGPYATKLIIGTNTAPFDLFRILGSRDCIFEKFSVQCSPAAPLNTAFVMETLAGTTIHNITFRDIIIEGGNKGGLDTGFATIAGTGGDNNNDNHYWDSVEVRNYTKAGWRFFHSQSKGHVLSHSSFWGNYTYSECGINTLGLNGRGGSFTHTGILGGGNTVADYQLGDANDFVAIGPGRLENSARLLTTPGPSGAVFPVRIQNIAWAGERVAADHRPLVFLFGGELLVDGCHFSGLGSSMELMIYQWSTGQATVTNTTIDSIVADPFVGTGPSVRINNRINRNDGKGNVVLDGFRIGNKYYNSAPDLANFRSALSASTPWSPGTIPSGTQVLKTLTVNGAVLGNTIGLPSFTADLQGMALTGYVSGANTITVVLRNDTGSPKTLAAGTLHVDVWAQV